MTKGALINTRVVSALKDAHDEGGLTLARDRIAQAYMGQWGGEATIEKARARIHWLTAQARGERVLDVGTSEGIVPILLGREGFRVVGIDINAEAIEYANQLLEQEPEAIRERVEFRNISLFQGETDLVFDTVIMGEVIEHVSNVRNFVETAVRYLAEEGTLIITTPFGVFPDRDHKHTFYLSDIRELLAPWGQIEHLSVTDGYIRAILRHLPDRDRSDGGKQSELVRDESLLALTEEATHASQVTLWRQLDLVGQRAEKSRQDLAAAKAEATEARAAQKALQAEMHALADELAQVRGRLATAEGGLVEREAAYGKLVQQLEKSQTQLDQQEAALATRGRALEAAQAERAQVEERHALAVKKLEALQQEVRNKLPVIADHHLLWEQPLVELLSKWRLSDAKKAKLCTDLAKGRFAEDRLATLLLSSLAYALDPLPYRQKWYGFCLYKAGFAEEAQLVLDGVEGTVGFSESESRVYADLKRSSKAVRVNAEAPTVPGVVPLKPRARGKGRLRVAGVMDEFTMHSYAPECELLQITPGGWKTEIEDFQADILFIESAWKGVDDLWNKKVSGASQELLDVIAWCRSQGIPTLFWNKEDPVHFSTFLPVAKAVDYVFTTDIDCIPKYKGVVGHPRVYLLPFAAQPAKHNPIELYDRKDAFNFAGSYYLRYPERQADFDVLIEAVRKFRPVEIYDRNAGNPHPHYQFPEKYAPMILGCLPFAEIDRAYKGYRYGINLNTIKQSQTMFARRIFELLASNTIVVSNFSRGARLLFGDLIVSSDNAGQLERRLDEICNDETSYRKLRLLGLRKVMGEHTYRHRLDYIETKVFGRAPERTAPAVRAVAVVGSVAEFERVQAAFEAQEYPHKRLYVLNRGETAIGTTDSCIEVFQSPDQCIAALTHEAAGQWVALLHPADHYGRHYFSDLCLATTYAAAPAFGKAAYYEVDGDSVSLKNDGGQYRRAAALDARCSLARLEQLDRSVLESLLARHDAVVLSLPDMLATDEFNYCRNAGGTDAAIVGATVDDADCLDQGVTLGDRLLPMAEQAEASAEPSRPADGSLPSLSAQEISDLLSGSVPKHIDLFMEGEALRLRSKLPKGKHTYIYATKALSRAEMNLLSNSQFELLCDREESFDVRTVFEFQDGQGKKISHSMTKAGGCYALAIPRECTSVRLGLRIEGPGEFVARRLVLGTHGQQPTLVAGKSRCLVLTKQYPAYDDLYRYGFLHSRVRAYREAGLLVDIFRITNEGGAPYREFEGVDIVSGNAHLLDQALRSGKYDHVLVHLLDEKMWDVLKRHIDNVRVTVWIHGAEIQVWQRRSFEFERMDAAEITRQKKLSNYRRRFWRNLFNEAHNNVKFVIVSKYFKDEISEDLGVSISDQSIHIIHNYIDPKIFHYEEKCAEDRFKILSIRPYSSRKYANDLSVAAVVELSKRACFGGMKFSFYGDGDLFEDTIEPLRQFDNVVIHKAFLDHFSIVKLHAENGVFLTPTRMDAQGVSRDEAMSSGLVPVTTDVAAIPEFVDGECGMVVPPEDPVALADAIEYLVENPDRYLAMSRAAVERVRRQSGYAATIAREVELINRESPGLPQEH